jgi:hypothetical protein
LGGKGVTAELQRHQGIYVGGHRHARVILRKRFYPTEDSRYRRRFRRPGECLSGAVGVPVSLACNPVAGSRSVADSAR